MGLKRSYFAFNTALSSLYENDLLTLADASDKLDFDDTAFWDAASLVYNAGGFDISQLNTPGGRRLVAETLNQIKKAIDSGIPHEVPEVVRYALENNAFVFSGFKAYHNLREVGLSLVTDKGDIKPFDTFRADVEQINNRYNHNYLYAEYNHAIGSSLMASRWQQIEADGDRYDLQYRTAEDDRVREDHAILNGTTLPPSDPFWSLYLPPNGWNCRCTAVQVRKNKYPQSDPALAMLRGNNCTENAKQQIFRYNPGKQLQLFPPKHPYYKAPEKEKVKQALDGYSPAEWTPKTIAQAEQFYSDQLGVKCSLKGFTKKNMEQVEAIFRSVERHFQCYPELKKETLFVGTILGRIELLTAAKLAELKITNPEVPDSILEQFAKEYARKVASCRNCYAYSHGAAKQYGLSGICFNSTWAGDKIDTSLKKDVNVKFHPPGCDTVKAVFDHELGHEIDRLLGLRSNTVFLKLYNQERAKGKQHIIDSLSTYGYKNEGEFIAEAWSEYLNNETPRPIAVAVGTMIKNMYAKKYQSSASSST